MKNKTEQLLRKMIREELELLRTIPGDDDSGISVKMYQTQDGYLLSQRGDSIFVQPAQLKKIVNSISYDNKRGKLTP